MNKKTLTRWQLEIYNPCKRDTEDRRKKVSFAVFSYLDNEGNEYRRSFTDVPEMPEQYFWDVSPKTILINKS